VAWAFAGGRVLPKLLIATSRDALRRNVGTTEADKLIRGLEQAGADVFHTVPSKAPALAAANLVSAAVRSEHEGVVLLGGYDVLPSLRLDVLDPKHRSALPNPHRDSDSFVVWSDDAYGEPVGGNNLPVSRVPDCKSAEFLKRALQVGSVTPVRTRFGIRNIARPFAVDIFRLLPGNRPLLVSEPTISAKLGSVPKRALYYLMLHGVRADGTFFSGECGGGCLKAIEIHNVPDSVNGVVFTGCCWGALIVDPPACSAVAGKPVRGRRIEASMALSFLAAGASAFIGCTGSHYSPLDTPFDYYGGPLHASFWHYLAGGNAPSRALFEAKRDYQRDFPHGLTDRFEQAVELKILRQFTCLGLGW
jgi:hypothetical protein